MPFISANIFFYKLNREFPRVMRRLCAEAMSLVRVHEDEVIFTRGDSCSRMLFVESGVMMYEWKKMVSRGRQSGVRRKSMAVDDHADGVSVSSGGQRVEYREWLSEAVLWTEWENKGTLTAGLVGSLLALEVADFCHICISSRDARSRCTLYCRSFIDILDRMLQEADLSDIMQAGVYEMPLDMGHVSSVSSISSSDQDLGARLSLVNGSSRSNIGNSVSA